jgi:hypothetical protein
MNKVKQKAKLNLDVTVVRWRRGNIHYVTCEEFPKIKARGRTAEKAGKAWSDKFNKLFKNFIESNIPRKQEVKEAS